MASYGAGTGAIRQEKLPSGYRKSSVNTYTPEMMELLEGMYGHVGEDSFLSKIASGDESAFNEMEAPALQQFSSMQGNLASRFSGMGSGARNSSGFQNTINQAASNFTQDMSSKRMEMRFKALEELMSFSDRLLGKNPYETGLVKKDRSSSGWGSAAGAVVGAGAGYMAGDPITGARIGYNVGKGF